MRPTLADAFRVAVDDDGQIGLDLGRAAPASQAEPGGAVTLSDRVVIGREAAERLLHGLREALARRPETAAESMVGTEMPPRADSLAGPSGPGASPLNLPPDPAAEKSALLLARIGALGVPYHYERSFRMAAGSLQANRFLTSMNRVDLGDAALERALDIARALGMPATAQAAAREQFDLAQCLHFGFEAGDGTMLCKLYLERRVPDDEVARAVAQGHGVLLHLAFKWDITSGAHVVTRYDWFPGLAPSSIEARLLALYGERPDSEPARIACETLALAGARASELQYLEVREADNGRHSFDLNLYDAGLQVRDMLPLLLRMRDHYAIRPGQFQALVDQIKPRALGHLAGGVHRDGRDFFNVYYGVTGFPQFASRLG
jgi:tryptophan halogenase